MKCSGSQIICTAPELQTRVTPVFEALIFAEILKPLSKSLGPFGELALGPATQQLFVRKTQ
jgi:hypothetical protein